MAPLVVEATEAAEEDDREGDGGGEQCPDDPGLLDLEAGHEGRTPFKPAWTSATSRTLPPLPTNAHGEDDGVAEQADDRRPPVEAGVHLAGQLEEEVDHRPREAQDEGRRSGVIEGSRRVTA